MAIATSAMKFCSPTAEGYASGAHGRLSAAHTSSQLAPVEPLCHVIAVIG